MSNTVANTLPLDQRIDPARWPVPTMPDVIVEPWAKDAAAFWKRRTIHRDVDCARTIALESFDNLRIGFGAGGVPWEGSTYGQPYQLLDAISPNTKVWNLGRAPTFRTTVVWSGWWPSLRTVRTDPVHDLPLPELVRREGDPGESSDSHWTGLSHDRLYEAIQLRRNPLNLFRTFNSTEWTLGYDGGGEGVAVWDTSRPWAGPGQPHGVVATGVPKFPMLVRWDRVRAAARIDATLGHAMFLGVPNYDRSFEGAARSSDGDLTGFPLRGGTIVRLRAHVADRYPVGTAERVIARTAHEFGMFVGDRNNASRGTFAGGAGCAVAMDRRFVVGEGDLNGVSHDFHLRLHDCEVIKP